MGEFIGAIAELFVIGSIGFWLISFVFFGLLTWATESDNDITAIIMIVAFGWILSAVPDNEISIIANPLVWLKWLAVYLAVGCTWSFIKWFSFLHRAKDALRDLKENFHKKQPLGAGFTVEEWEKNTEGRPSTWTKSIFKLFGEYVYKNGYVNDFLRAGTQYVGEEFVKKPEDLIPTVKNRFSRLTRWILWWPMSAVWTLLNDPLRRLVEFIVRSLKIYYTKLANSVLGNEI
jgi:hypothetical protein